MRRLGSTRDERVDVWILATTYVDLKAAIDSHRRYCEAFNLHETLCAEHLYQELGRHDVLIPPLRQRPGDIHLLAQHFLVRVCADRCVPPKSFAADARSAMLSYQWPGNVREVKYVIEHAARRFAKENIVTAAMLALPK